uniref:Uncharacterized protein n=1 Tax=Spongospora subterranea TaxID=70186 RepID=A0A0H5RBA5_9EUKA|eukprot:CRZ05749.1 hypothetical protein [Spongospora subterranea]
MFYVCTGGKHWLILRDERIWVMSTVMMMMMTEEEALTCWGFQMVRRGKILNAALASHHTSLTCQRDFLRSLCTPLLRPCLHDGACFQFSTNMVNKVSGVICSHLPN